MLEERTIDLINADIDGEIGPRERDELETILAASEDARAYRAEMLKLANLLEATPEVAPPPDLAARVADGLSPQPRRRVLSSRGFFRTPRLVPVGIAFAAGLLLTVGLFDVIPDRGSPADSVSMVGTMVTGKPVEQLPVEDSLIIEQREISGTISLQRMGDYLAVNFDLDSGQPTEIEVALAAAGLTFGGIAYAQPASDSADRSFELAAGDLRVINNGRQAFTVFLPGAGGGSREIAIGINSGGKRVFDGVLRG
jgi:anti-sigma factor RsiW